MSEERFFNQMKDSLQSYAPEVPEAVYAGMRKKLWWSNFTRFSATRLNMWYLILLVGATGTAIAMSSSNASSSMASKGTIAPVQTVVNVASSQEVNATPAAQNASCSHSCSENKTTCTTVGWGHGSASCGGSPNNNIAIGSEGSTNDQLTASTENGLINTETTTPEEITTIQDNPAPTQTPANDGAKKKAKRTFKVKEYVGK
jgi:hypothetical protein